MSVVASPVRQTKEENSGVLRLIAVLEEFFVYTSAGKRVVDINVAAGIALAELRRLKGFYEDEDSGDGQEAGSSGEPVLKAI